MPTWIVDTRDKVAQQVIPTADNDPSDPRFRKVHADTLREAFEQATFESVALKKMARILAGSEEVMSTKEYDFLIDVGAMPTNVASIPNPQRMGLLDAWLVALSTSPSIVAARQKVQDEYEARPEIKAYRQRCKQTA